MKSLFRAQIVPQFGIVAIITVIGFTMVACNNSTTDTTDHTSTTCSHTPGAAATCTTAQVCTDCEDVLQAALGHAVPVCTREGHFVADNVQMYGWKTVGMDTVIGDPVGTGVNATLARFSHNGSNANVSNFFTGMVTITNGKLSFNLTVKPEALVNFQNEYNNSNIIAPADVKGLMVGSFYPAGGYEPDASLNKDGIGGLDSLWFVYVDRPVTLTGDNYYLFFDGIALQTGWNLLEVDTFREVTRTDASGFKWIDWSSEQN